MVNNPELPDSFQCPTPGCESMSGGEFYEVDGTLYWKCTSDKVNCPRSEAGPMTVPMEAHQLVKSCEELLNYEWFREYYDAYSEQTDDPHFNNF